MHKKNILLINGWSDDNKGDAAIVVGLIKLLQETQKGRIGIVSNFSANNKKFSHHYRHTAPEGGNISVYGSLLPLDREGKSAFLRRIRMLWLLFRSLLILVFIPIFLKFGFDYFLNSKDRSSLRAFVDADLIISKGGHIYSSTGGFFSIVGLYQNLYPLLLAQRLKKKAVIYAQSIGPVLGTIQKKILSSALNKTKIIYVREQLSLELVNKLLDPDKNKSEEKLRLVWDTAFAVTREILPDKIITQLPPKFVAITVRQWHFPYQPKEDRKSLYRNYLKSIADAVSYINETKKLPVVFIPQVIGPTAAENDFTAWKDLEPLLKNSNYLYIEGDLTPGQLVSLYEKAEILIGTRFHSVILAAIVGIPSVAISYHGYKTKGIMSMLNSKDRVIDIEDINSDKLLVGIDYVISHRDKLSSELIKKHKLILSESVSGMKQVLNSNL